MNYEKNQDDHAALEADNPDLKVLPPDIQKMHRAEALQKIILESTFENTIAVSGSCGKGLCNAATSSAHAGAVPGTGV